MSTARPVAFPRSPSSHRRWDQRTALLLIGVGAIVLLLLGVPSVQRTQEARVLEVARQMRSAGTNGDPIHAFLVPHLNGALRLQKPPLAYWLAAGSYATFGEANAWVGRVPFALAWLATAAATYLIGRRLFGGRAGFFAGAGVVGCMMGVRFGVLAETDVLASLFTTIASWTFWKALGTRHGRAPSFAEAAANLHLAAAATALAALAKGPPAFFPVLFFVTLAIVRRDGRGLLRFLTSGALLTFTLIAAPWFVYILATIGYTTFAHELKVAAEGGGHRGSFLSYFAYLIIDTAPWSLLTCLALFTAGTRVVRRRPAEPQPLSRKRDPRIVGLVVWFWTTLLPLCVIGQKQRHYLAPLLPPLMLLVGWYVDRALRLPRSHRPVVRSALIATATLAGLAALALPLIGRAGRPGNHAFAIADAAVLVAMLALAAGIGTMLRRRNLAAAAMCLTAIAPIAFVLLQLVWDPTVERGSPRAIARDLRERFGPRPLRFLPPDDLPLQFESRTLPHARTPVGSPLILMTTRESRPTPLPPGVGEVARYPVGDDDVVIVGDTVATESQYIPESAEETASPATIPSR